jgi:hypothetical protein
MAEQNPFAVVTLDTLAWPASLTIPSPRFRLFVAADTTQVTVEGISRFAEIALTRGMVYFCAWGPGCERFHDIVDEILVGDEVFGKHRFTRPTPNDVVMTTWHANEDLEEALDFFATCAIPSEGYAAGSDYRVFVCVGHPEWAATAQKFLQEALLK